MKIGITSQNFRTITGHAGKARRFMIFEAFPDGRIAMTQKHDLPKEASIHEHPDAAPHPIDGLDVLITGSCGDGFVRKMAARGVKVVATGETDPQTAIAAFLSGNTLAPPSAKHDDLDDHGACGCACGGGHSH